MVTISLGLIEVINIILLGLELGFDTSFIVTLLVTNVVPKGTVSFTCTFSAGILPVFVSVSVYVNISPTFAVI